MSSNCECPRCGSRSMERLSTYSHCPNCLYFEDFYDNGQALLRQALAAEREVFGPQGSKKTEESDANYSEAS